jgi:formylglycine-generating enzyme required for sulfatase activity
MLMARDGQYERAWAYPWGEKLRIDYLNCRSRYAGSTKTTPIGLFKEGRTPDLRIYDVLGNVWEWTSSRQGGAYTVKGMAWDTMDADIGVNAVDYVSPHEKRDNIGFRILQEI